MYSLIKWHNYSNSWNMLSRVFILKENIKDKNIFILDNEDDIKKFSKLYKYFVWRDLNRIQDEKDLLG